MFAAAVPATGQTADGCLSLQNFISHIILQQKCKDCKPSVVKEIRLLLTTFVLVVAVPKNVCIKNLLDSKTGILFIVADVITKLIIFVCQNVGHNFKYVSCKVSIMH